MSSTNGNSSKNQDNQQNAEQNHSRQASSGHLNFVHSLTAIISLKSLLTNVVPSDDILNNEGNLANKNLEHSSKIHKIIEDNSPGRSNTNNITKNTEQVVTSNATKENVEGNLTLGDKEGNHLDEHHSCFDEENIILDRAKELKSTPFYENITQDNKIIVNNNNSLKQDSDTTLILTECNTSHISNENRRVLSQIVIANCNNSSHDVRTTLEEAERQMASTSPTPLHEANLEIPVVANFRHVQAKQLFEQDSEVEITITPPPVPPCVIHGPPPLAGAPPTYSAVMRVGSFTEILPPPIARRREVPIQPSPPFIAPIPPPSYAEAEGFYMETAVASGNILLYVCDVLVKSRFLLVFF